MFCSKCGKDLSAGTQFCPKCGAAVNSPDKKLDPASLPAPKTSVKEMKSAVAVKERPPETHGRKALLLAAVLAVVLIAAAVYILPKVIPLADGGAAAQAPDAELLAIIDQVEAAHQKAADEFSALQEKKSEELDSMEKLRQQAQIFERFLAELEELRTQSDTVSGLDAKLKTAKDEYFNMLRDARTAHVEVIKFLVDYLDFAHDILYCCPLQVDYDSLHEYSEALNAWTQEARAGYEAISYPLCVADEWEQYGKILEYNDSIAQKTALAAYYNDWLRLYSALNMTERYNKTERNQYKRLLNCFEGEINFANNQQWTASKLAGEIHAYTEMTPDEKDAYEFEYIRTGKISLNYDVVNTIYPSLYNTYDAFAIIKTGCTSGKRTIVVEAEIEGFTQKYRESITLDASYREIYIKPPALTGELNLAAAKPAQLRITISEKDGTLIDEKTFGVTLKSKSDFEWYSDEYGTATQDNILCYLTPESTAITQLKRCAIDELGIMAGRRFESFVGYQNINSNWNKYTITYLQAAGLMHALSADLDVRYNMNPFSISGSNQHIQLPEEVIANRSGLCIETSLVIASALQSANMHAFLLFPPGHAQVAVEVWDRGEEAGEYFLIETTKLSSADNTLDHFVENANGLLKDPVSKPSTGIITYYNSNQWHDYLKNSVEYIVDCDDSRLLGMAPFAN